VKTTWPNHDLREEWTDEGWARKKWGVRGKVITHHDSHGLCYDVYHEDGSTGCYDPSELEIISNKARENMSKRPFNLIKKEINEIDKKISSLLGQKGMLEVELKKSCNHPANQFSERGNGYTVCDKCGAIVSHVPPRKPSGY